MPFAAQLAIPLPSDLRTARRRAVNFPGFVRESVATVVPVEVTNLSTDGCSFQAAGSFETATVVWLRVAGLGARQARIVWAGKGNYGCEFCSPLQSEVVEQLYENEQRKLRAGLQGGPQGFGRAAGVPRAG
jgi:hypothetical protein